MDISVEQAVDLLQNEQVVALPTETVYGLAALASSQRAVRAIFALKQRPLHNPLILHVRDMEECLQYALPHQSFFDLAHAFWPGPLTCILPARQERILPEVRAGLATCAFRCPSHPIMHQVLEQVSPLVAPSANLSGRPSATCRAHVEEDFGSAFPVLDAGRTACGIESTIVMYQDGAWCIARQGAISQEALGKHLGYLPEIASTKQVICPGQLLRHYAPRAKMHLLLHPDAPYVLGYKDRSYPGAQRVFSLGNSTDPDAMSFHLYDTLREIDLHQIKEVWVDLDLPDVGLYRTIKERLRKAASS
jgi:L-threonylcarbamoyladenylate synthase